MNPLNPLWWLANAKTRRPAASDLLFSCRSRLCGPCDPAHCGLAQEFPYRHSRDVGSDCVLLPPAASRQAAGLAARLISTYVNSAPHPESAIADRAADNDRFQENRRTTIKSDEKHESAAKIGCLLANNEYPGILDGRIVSTPVV
jgi:hypothetical protein